MRKKTKQISWIKNTLVFMMMKSGNVLSVISTYQQDKQLLALQLKYPDNYVNLQLDGNVNGIICYKKDSTQPN